MVEEMERVMGVRLLLAVTVLLFTPTVVAFNLEDARQLASGYTAAWNTGSADAVASFYADDGQISINRGEPWKGRSGLAEMAQGFFNEVPDLNLVCDEVRVSGDHVVYLWTFTGTHAAHGKPLRISGWEEWNLDVTGKILSSSGWYDAEDYARQAGTMQQP